ncbi:MAG TPA: hypothetical protein VFR81_23895 [Longimicrobium sp.]|nr:hypothetical protein [Longimicrobium sp.]
MHLSPGSCTHAPDAADLEPQSHIVYHDRAAGANPEPGLSRDAEAVASATRITRHGGLIIELGRRPSDPEQAIHITAILTVAQAVGMLFEQAQDEVGGISPPPALFACPTPAVRGEAGMDAVAAWVRDKDEEARRLGVPRLALLLSRAGIGGDVDVAADQLWTACGY